MNINKAKELAAQSGINVTPIKKNPDGSKFLKVTKREFKQMQAASNNREHPEGADRCGR